MKKLLVSLSLVALCVAAPLRSADEKHDHKMAPQAKSAAFDEMKKLVGDWVMTEGGKEFTTSFKLTSAGTVLVETLAAGKPMEMVTMYHMDGPDLVMTHYCALGNQPKLKADSASDAKKISFKSVGGTNMKLNDMHMGRAVFTMIDKDNFESEWCSCTSGKPDDAHKMTFKFTRVKK